MWGNPFNRITPAVHLCAPSLLSFVLVLVQVPLLLSKVLTHPCFDSLIRSDAVGSRLRRLWQHAGASLGPVLHAGLEVSHGAAVEVRTLVDAAAV